PCASSMSWRPCRRRVLRLSPPLPGAPRPRVAQSRRRWRSSMATISLVERLLGGDRRALARVVTLVENAAPETHQILAQLHAHGGQAHVVGVTGAPGAGKSTLVMQLARELRRRDQRVGIIAVDPSSPFTGGAILGDRIRMQEIAGDPKVFIRS